MKTKHAKLSARDIEVLIALINPENPKFRRTQAEACNLLGYEPYVVSRSVKRLIEGKYIRKLEHHSKGALYVKHTRYPIAISQVTDEFRTAYDAKVQLVADKVAITYPPTDEMLQESFTLQPHISGAVPFFKVITEGKLQFKQEESYNADVVPRGAISTLDLQKREKGLNGSEDWGGSFVLSYGRSFILRYQRTKKCKNFYISPQYDIESSPNELLENIDAPYNRVILECYPMLDWLSKYAGWKFVTDADGNYIPLNKTHPKDVHIQINHNPTTDFLNDCTGSFTADGVRADRSGGTLRFEVNANRTDFIEALADSPVTRLLTHKHENDISQIKDSHDREKQEIWNTIEMLVKLQAANIENAAIIPHRADVIDTDIREEVMYR